MKKIIIFVFLAIFLTACAPAIKTNLECSSQGACTATIVNTLGHDIKDVDINLYQENRQEPIGKESVNVGTSAEYRVKWKYNYVSLFNTNQDFKAKETKTFKVNVYPDYKPGSLLKIEAKYFLFSDIFATEFRRSAKYCVVEPSLNTRDFITSTITCLPDWTVKAEVYSNASAPEKIMAIYIDEELDDQYAKILLKPGETKILAIKVPEGTSIVEFDFLGHEDKELHNFSKYCTYK